VLYNFEDTPQTVTLADLAEPITLTLRGRAPGFVHVGPDGSIQALEAQGQVMIGKQVVLETEAHVLLRALDGVDFRQSGALAVMPLEPGRVRLATRRTWKTLLGEAGEVAGGAWHAWEQFPLAAEAGGVTFEVDEDRARAILVLAEAAALPEVTARVARQVRWE
jgi:hypothetical protein